MSQILDGEDTNSINIANNNAGTYTNNTSGTRNAGGTGDIENNSDGKNANVKTGFGIYNIANANADADAM